jgi:hypothetical protein
MTNKEFNVSMMKLTCIFFVIIVIPSFFYNYGVVSSVIDFVSIFIPSVNRYGDATLFSDNARSVFAISWLLSPVVFACYMRMTKFGVVGETKYNRSVIFIFISMLLVSFFSLFYGVYGNHDYVRSVGVFHGLFIKSVFGVYAFNYILWICFYVTFGFVLNKIKFSLLGDKK